MTIGKIQAVKGPVPPMQQRWAAARPPIGSFASGLVAYAVAEMWHDFIAIYLLRLDSRPYCDDRLSCASVEGSHPAFLFAFACFVIGAAINVAVRHERMRDFPSLDAVPAMTSMLCGFAFGDAVLKLRSEAFEAMELGCDEPYADCGLVDVGAATLSTVLVVCAVTAALPLTRRQNIDFGGSGALVDSAEKWTKTLFVLLSKSLATSLYVVWTAVLTRWAAFGAVRPPLPSCAVEAVGVHAQLQRISLGHTHFFWAATVTWLGSIASVQCARLQLRLVPAAPQPRGGDDALEVWHTTLTQLIRLLQVRYNLPPSSTFHALC